MLEPLEVAGICALFLVAGAGFGIWWEGEKAARAEQRTTKVLLQGLARGDISINQARAALHMSEIYRIPVTTFYDQDLEEATDV